MPTSPGPRDADAALDILFHPFATGALQWPREGGALFLRAREGWPLHARPLPGLIAEQSYKPAFDALQRSGIDVHGEDVDGTFPLVLVLPPRQRDEARALFARAVAQAGANGTVVACMHNDEGAKTGQAELARLTGPVNVLSKQHCRVFWTGARVLDSALLEQWRALDAPRLVADGTLHSRPGVFAWDRIDVASALLLRHLPTDLAGEGADLGAGIGVLAMDVLARCKGVRSIDLYDAERRALELARRNLAAQANVGFHWHDVTQGVSAHYDFIVMNPPFHAQSRADRPDLGRRFIEVAAQALRARGRLVMVANRHLPYEAVLGGHFAQVRMLADASGFKVVEAVRA
ncbi:Ribosomal RNA small subunit methyltransferase C [Lysobacter dokdonensis DS-58]|uniref:Ribosomal RNA small subunit methyltransferase C n=1 Tax=Lysobacter dokdonensis DS-58 TaxID=1300345 RepID=A0A0A2WD51_9GAMM|nr:class I SAM-dependent methyltransferase [Lysobacter dokdonensis]KGQ18141.1 Ribosomal RNA small subunit methyltransferase C [Lysobacter dokdonensis DS-58]